MLCLCGRISGQTFQKLYNYGRAHHVIRTPANDGFVLTGDLETNTNDRAFLIRTDNNGNRIWGKFYRDFIEFYSWGNVVLPLSNGYLLAGMTFNDTIGNQEIGLTRVDTAGNLRWSKRIGNLFEDDEIVSAIQISDGFLLFGSTEGFGAFESDMLLIRTDTSGNVIAAHTFGTSMPDHGRKILYFGNEVFLFGESETPAGAKEIFVIVTDLAGQIRSQRKLTNVVSGSSVSLTIADVVRNDSRFVLAGNVSGPTMANGFFVADVDSVFNPVHAFIANQANAVAHSVACFSINYAVAGELSGGQGGFIFQFDTTLSYAGIQYGDSNRSSLNSIVYNGNDTIISAGEMVLRNQISPHLYFHRSGFLSACDSYPLSLSPDPILPFFIQDTAFVHQNVSINSVSALVTTSNITVVDTDYCSLVSVSDPQANDLLQIYPNPAVDEITIKSDQPFESVLIFDLAGKELIRTADNKISFDLSSGCYWMSIVYHNGKRINRKFLVK